MTVKLNPNYRSDIAVVFNVPELTDEQLKRFADIGFILDNDEDGTDLMVWKNIKRFSTTAHGSDGVGIEEALPAFDGQVQSDYVFDTVDELLDAITVES